MDMIENLYRGNIYEESIKPKSKRFQEAKKQMGLYSEVLESKLSEDQQKALDDYLDAQSTVLDCEYLEFFRQGLIIGVKLMLEIL